MDFLLTDEQKLIQQTAREFAQNEVAKDAAERDQKAKFPAQHVKKMAELGFMGMMIAPEYGGAGLDAVSYAIVIEELSRVDASVGVICSVNNSLVCFGIENSGKEETKKNGPTRKTTGKIVFGIKDGKWTLISFDERLIYGYYGLRPLQ